MRIVFDDTDVAIDIPDGDEFAGVLQRAAFDWPFREDASDRTPVVTIRKSASGYTIDTPGYETIEAPVVAAACSAVVDAVKGFIDRHPERLCLHCGSAVLGGKLVVFPGQYRAGKSTLTSRLAHAGYTVFGDDVLPLDETDTHGVAIGIAPRLRVPLPATATESFRAFVEAHRGAADHRYHYLDSRSGIARRGTRAPLGAVVLLDRRPDGPATLFEASRAAALHLLITQNFARADSAGDLLERMHRLMDRLPRFTLRYSSLEDAVEVLERTFRTWPPQAETAGAADPPMPDAADGETAGYAGRRPVFDRSAPLMQNPAVRMRQEDGELFLADSEGWGIHRLNRIGTAIWNLLTEPTSTEEIASILHGAFPETDSSVIQRDVDYLVGALLAEGFVIEADAADCGYPRKGS